VLAHHPVQHGLLGAARGVGGDERHGACRARPVPLQKASSKRQRTGWRPLAAPGGRHPSCAPEAGAPQAAAGSAVRRGSARGRRPEQGPQDAPGRRARLHKRSRGRPSEGPGTRDRRVPRRPWSRGGDRGDPRPPEEATWATRHHRGETGTAERRSWRRPASRRAVLCRT
jgi:hypothetical protein